MKQGSASVLTAAAMICALAPAARADETTIAPAHESIPISAAPPADLPPPDAAPAATATATATAPPPRLPTGSFSIGAGYLPDEGFIARAEVAQSDLFRTGQRLAVSADLSAIAQRFRIAHEVPDAFGSGLDLQTELFSTRRAYPAFTREAAGGAITLGKRLSPHTRIYARYRLEHVALSDLSLSLAAAPAASSAAPAAAQMELPSSALGAGLFASLGGGIEHSTLDAPLLPRSGSRLALFAERADRRLGSDVDLWHVGGALDHARALGPFTLRLHGHASAVRSRDPLGVPLAHRLHYEGHAAVRGYPAGAGSPTGDNFEAVGRVELELPIIRRWGISIAGFADAGLRGNRDAFWAGNDPLLQRSVGVSIIWRSPIGTLRFDWALPLDGSRRDLQYLFGVGY